MACGWKGPLVNLVQEWRALQGNHIIPRNDEMLALLREIAVEVVDPEERKKRIKASARFDYSAPREVAGVLVGEGSMPVAEPLSLDTDDDPLIEESWLERFELPPPEVMVWLNQRGLTDATVKLWELRWQPHVERLIIPIRDLKGRLVGLSGRAMNGEKPKFKHSHHFHKTHYLYGEHFFPQRGMDTGYVVEGFFDVMYLRQYGYPAVAVMGSSAGPLQRLKISKFMRSVVIVPDGDAPGYEAARRLQGELGTVLPVRVAAVPEGKDPDQLDEGELRALLLS